MNAAICEHVDLPDTALCVTAGAPRGAVRVCCPCCGLSGWHEATDAEPMVCPYCDRPAVVDLRLVAVDPEQQP